MRSRAENLLYAVVAQQQLRAGVARAAAEEALTLEGELSTDLDAVEAVVGEVPTIGTFTSQTGAVISTLTTSNAAAVSSAANMVWQLAVRGQGSPQMEVNGTGVWGEANVVRNGDTVKVRLTSSGSPATAFVATLYYQGGSQSFSVTTAP